MALGGKKLLAIDWDKKNLRLVLVRILAEGVELLKAVSVPISASVALDQPESLGAFIREAVRQAGVGAKRVAMCIPRDQVVLNALSVPAGPAEDLPAIVQFQIAKELPFPIEQATLDFAVMGRFNPLEPGRLLVAAVRNEQLQFYKMVAEAAGLAVERIGLRPHANLISVLAKAPERAQKSLLLVEVGPQLTEIDIIRDGALAFSRAASVAVSDIADGVDTAADDRAESLHLVDPEHDNAGRIAVRDLMLEVTRSFEAYRATEPAASVDQVVVCGALGIETELAEMLGARFACRAELYTPEQAMGLTPPRARELRGFSAALGLAIGHDGEGLGHFDFLHTKKPISKQSIRLKKVPTVVLTAALLIAAAYLAHDKYVRPLLDTNKDLVNKINKLKDAEKNALEFQAQVEALDDWQRSEQYWPDVLKVLSEKLPADHEAYATRIDFEIKRAQKKSKVQQGTVRVNLRTAKLGQVNDIAGTLKKSGFLTVRPGKDAVFSSRNPTEMAYHYDTSIDAELPEREVLFAENSPETEESASDDDASQSKEDAARQPEKPVEQPESVKVEEPVVESEVPVQPVDEGLSGDGTTEDLGEEPAAENPAVGDQGSDVGEENAVAPEENPEPKDAEGESSEEATPPDGAGEPEPPPEEGEAPSESEGGAS